jgi:hypothetical protein
MTIELKERDLQSKLRYWAKLPGSCYPVPSEILDEAAAQLDALTAERDKWRDQVNHLNAGYVVAASERDTALQQCANVARILGPVLELEAKATPGPWRCCGENRGGCQCGAVWAPDGETLLMQRGDWEDHQHASREAAAANALLVNAARKALPELRAALATPSAQESTDAPGSSEAEGGCGDPCWTGCPRCAAPSDNATTEVKS